ncbi:MAG: hypothetical protein H6Q81_1600, partial [Deltaproteobacteria bacterium]|nr:hypothetical protein [Deltaproteobacteria bacterium]
APAGGAVPPGRIRPRRCPARRVEPAARQRPCLRSRWVGSTRMAGLQCRAHRASGGAPENPRCAAAAGHPHGPSGEPGGSPSRQATGTSAGCEGKPWERSGEEWCAQSGEGGAAGASSSRRSCGTSSGTGEGARSHAEEGQSGGTAGRAECGSRVARPGDPRLSRWQAGTAGAPCSRRTGATSSGAGESARARTDVRAGPGEGGIAGSSFPRRTDDASAGAGEGARSRAEGGSIGWTARRSESGSRFARPGNPRLSRRRRRRPRGLPGGRPGWRPGQWSRALRIIPSTGSFSSRPLLPIASTPRGVPRRWGAAPCPRASPPGREGGFPFAPAPPELHRC